jgi:hypothetical protein
VLVANALGHVSFGALEHATNGALGHVVARLTAGLGVMAPIAAVATVVLLSLAEKRVDQTSRTESTHVE